MIEINFDKQNQEMILIIGHESFCQRIIPLLPDQIDTRQVKDILELKHTIKESHPSLILIDSEMPAIQRILYRLKFSYHSRFTPVLALAHSLDNLDQRRFHRFGIREVLAFDNANLIQEKLKHLLAERRYANSYTNRFINSLVDYEGSRAIATRMIHIFDRLIRDYEIEVPNSFDAKGVLALLSVTIRTGKPRKVMKFFSDMRFAEEVRKLLVESFSPQSQAAQIVHIIHKTEEALWQKRDIQSVRLKSTDTVLAETIRYLYRNITLIVNSKTDLETFYEQVLMYLSDEESMDEMQIGILVGELRTLLEDIVVKLESFVIRLEHDGELQIRIITQDTSLLQELVDNHPSSTFTAAIDPDEGCLLLWISSPTLSTTEKITAISASEFISNLDGETIETEDLIDLEYEIEAALSNRNLEQKVAEQLRDILQQYAAFLDRFAAFQSVSLALFSLGSKLESGGTDHLEEKKLLIPLFESLIDDLRRWRESIFVYQDANDIHFMDASFLSNAKQIEIILSGNQEDGGIEFF